LENAIMLTDRQGGHIRSSGTKADPRQWSEWYVSFPLEGVRTAWHHYLLTPLYFVDYISPDLKRDNVNFHRQIPWAIFGSQKSWPSSPFHRDLRIPDIKHNYKLCRKLFSDLNFINLK
jgi:hypothetical protein